MKKSKLSFLLGVAICSLAAHPAIAQSNAPDNTRANKENASSDTRNADDQKENATDRDYAKRIRQSVMADKGLSTYAHNIKIVSVNGNVTLDGVVRSDEERNSIGSKAEAVAGHGHVVNELKIAPGH
jgi:osmotically-inducible protein OsmY